MDLIRQFPIRWAMGDEGRSPDTVIVEGFFQGAGECARVLSTVAPLEIVDGWAFGGAWPLLVGAGRVLAPAMPVAVSPEAPQACDGEYRHDGDLIWREAVGVDEPFLRLGGSPEPPGAAFDFLCFGPAERYAVCGGVLEIEDLFGMLSVPATADLLDRVFVRGLRLNPAILASVQAVAGHQPQAIEVCRPATLIDDERWRNAQAFLATRADIESAQSRGECVEVVGIDKEVSVFAFEEHAKGWQLDMRDGRYPLTCIRLERRAAALRVRATLAGWVDGLAPGMRGRLIFDLRSDLVALG